MNFLDTGWFIVYQKLVRKNENFMGVFIHKNAVKWMYVPPCFQKISGDLNRREGKRQESSTPPNFWHESPPLACESIVKRCTIAFYNSEMHIWLHMLQLNLCRSRYYWLLANGHGKIHDGHGKVMEFDLSNSVGTLADSYSIYFCPVEQLWMESVNGEICFLLL